MASGLLKFTKYCTLNTLQKFDDFHLSELLDLIKNINITIDKLKSNESLSSNFKINLFKKIELLYLKFLRPNMSKNYYSNIFDQVNEICNIL